MSEKGRENISYQEINGAETEEKLQINENAEETPINTGPKFGKRHVETILFTSGIFIQYLMRVNMSLTIVAMTDPNANPNKDITTYNWTNKNIILSSFFWGYVIPQIVAGWLMTRYGPKWFVIASLAISSLVGFLIPPVAFYFGSSGVIICRIIQGFCQGFLIPSIPVFMSRWIPINERSRIGAFLYASGSIGTVFSMMISGSISASTYGWPMVFHCFASLGIIWCIIYAICGNNSPGKTKSINQDELAYIESSAVVIRKKMLKTPWGKIFTSIPFFALIYSYTCFILGFWILQSQIPTYLNKVLLFNLKSNGLLSSMPYIMQWLLGLVFSVFSDYLSGKNILSITNTRKLFTAIGSLGPAICLSLLPFSTNASLAVAYLIIGVGVNGAGFCSIFLNNLDLSPNFSGVTQGFINGFSNISGVVAPLIAQALITDENNPAHWSRLFYLASGIYLSAAIVFGIFGSGSVQTWNDPEETKETKEMTSLK